MTGCTLTRRERLLVAIWENWRDRSGYNLQQLARSAGYWGKGSVAWGVLEARGWIVRSGVGVFRPVIPGPRFGGIDRKTGRPLYVLDGCGLPSAVVRLRARGGDGDEELYEQQVQAARRLGA